MFRRTLCQIIGATLILQAAFIMSAQAEDIPIVNGQHWTKSSLAEKKAYLVGLSNMLDLEYAFQKRSGNPPSDKQSLVRRLYESTDSSTLDGAIAQIDGWYKANPNKQTRTVLAIIWTEIAKQPTRGSSK